MNNNKVIACLNELAKVGAFREGENYTYHNQVVLRNSMYILQQLGIKTGIKFEFGIAGVYSKELSALYYVWLKQREQTAKK